MTDQFSPAAARPPAPPPRSRKELPGIAHEDEEEDDDDDAGERVVGSLPPGDVIAPGHETYRDFYMDPVQRIFANAVEWAAPKRV